MTRRDTSASSAPIVEEGVQDDDIAVVQSRALGWSLEWACAHNHATLARALLHAGATKDYTAPDDRRVLRLRHYQLTQLIEGLRKQIDESNSLTLPSATIQVVLEQLAILYRYIPCTRRLSDQVNIDDIIVELETMMFLSMMNDDDSNQTDDDVVSIDMLQADKDLSFTYQDEVDKVWGSEFTRLTSHTPCESICPQCILVKEAQRWTSMTSLIKGDITRSMLYTQLCQQYPVSDTLEKVTAFLARLHSNIGPPHLTEIADTLNVFANPVMRVGGHDIPGRGKDGSGNIQASKTGALEQVPGTLSESTSTNSQGAVPSQESSKGGVLAAEPPVSPVQDSLVKDDIIPALPPRKTRMGKKGRHSKSSGAGASSRRKRGPRKPEANEQEQEQGPAVVGDAPSTRMPTARASGLRKRRGGVVTDNGVDRATAPRAPALDARPRKKRLKK